MINGGPIETQIQSWIPAIIGGLLIGTAASILLLFSGNILGVSGIISKIITHPIKEFREGWRWEFLIGLFSGGLIILILKPELFENTLSTPNSILIIAGILVGFGTKLGGGCTSGHGVCGVSRLSKRSLIATILFLLTGILTATFLRPWITL